ncbi:hypothetical protein RhiLY_02559 [Ceratobasidium sp. AG-Ba]|nr:hypothetical protein RhiLY_02559 [Ceratobasidium sp. AG-Ba]
MPRAEHNPIATPQPATPYPASAEEEGTNGRRYQTRRVALKFSHTKTPYFEPPKPPEARPPVPKSSARRKNRANTTSANPPPTNETSQGVDVSISAGQTSQTVSDTAPEHQPAHSVPLSEHPPSSALAPVGVSTQDTPSASMLEASTQNTPSVLLPETSGNTNIECINTQGVNTALARESGHGGLASVTMLSGSVFSTLSRPNRISDFATPAVVIIQNSQDWPRPDYDDSQFPTFVPNSLVPFDHGILPVNLSPHPNSHQMQIQHSGFSSWKARENEFAPPESGSNVSSGLQDFSTLNRQPFPPPPVTMLSTPALQAPAPDAGALFTTIMNTPPPHFPTAPTASMLIHPFNAPGMLEHPNNSSTTCLFPTDPIQPEGSVVAISRTSSTALDAVSGSNSTWRSSIAPLGVQPSSARLPNPPATTLSGTSLKTLSKYNRNSNLDGGGRVLGETPSNSPSLYT